jgi:hypothetical protein
MLERFYYEWKEILFNPAHYFKILPNKVDVKPLLAYAAIMWFFLLPVVIVAMGMGEAWTMRVWAVFGVLPIAFFLFTAILHFLAGIGGGNRDFLQTLRVMVVLLSFNVFSVLNIPSLLLWQFLRLFGGLGTVDWADPTFILLLAGYLCASVAWCFLLIAIIRIYGLGMRAVHGMGWVKSLALGMMSLGLLQALVFFVGKWLGQNVV